MGFRGINQAHFARFNSAVSCDFLDFYEEFVEAQIEAENTKPSSRTFAPSSFQCDRKSWFRLRGTAPDSQSHVDRALNFTAEIGTACHEIIQKNLSEALGPDWISVEEFLKDHPIPYSYTLTQDGYETKVEITEPIPIRFACDGILRWQGKYYLLEIKTSEFTSFQDLTNVKEKHVDQIRCYCTLLGLSDVIVLYQDRQYGDFKCYTMHVGDGDKQTILDRFVKVRELADANIAPDALPKNDPFCNGCPYTHKCSEWGR